MSANHIPKGANSINPYLTVKGCEAAIDFYIKAFGATEKYRLTMPDGSIGHAELVIENSLLMISEENKEWGNLSPLTIGGNPVLLSLYVKDVDAVYQQAIVAGATASKGMDVKDEFYGDRAGRLTDPFGHSWMIATHKQEVSPEEMQKRMDEMMKK